MEHGLVWVHLKCCSSIGVAYVDSEQYPETELDGNETLRLPGVHELLIANGKMEVQVNDCRKQLLRSYKVAHALEPGQTDLESDEGDLQVRHAHPTARTARLVVRLRATGTARTARSTSP